MKKYIVFLIMFIMLLSCSKEDLDKYPFVDIQDIPLIWREYYSDALTQEYSYTSERLLYEVKSKWIYTVYTYNNANQVVSYDKYFDLRLASPNPEIVEQAMNRTDWVTPENTEINRRANYTYSNDKLTKYEITLLTTGEKTWYTFEHDKNSRISKRTSYHEYQPIQSDEFFYDDKGNLITEIRNHINDGTPVMTRKIEYEFDDKNNPYIVFQRLLEPGVYTNKNNILKEIVTLYSISDTQETNHTYEYNSDGYPIRMDDVITLEYLPLD
jgi:hypothetical protein